ncbi:MAG: MATE family efflux transporter [marine benthic group bacterium]|nr:MATE family efflux transporter [Gemmatimonadota bacterium]MCL7957719.1 MATE family efflux transporter [Gemmatimonadota bacterium]MCL7963617.1 MATE family efflux transporter [Candidatus Carthagonibacter metallireducens]MCL7984366.1 MATE family efflux transporter [Gemmatimonadota bacterium]
MSETGELSSAGAFRHERVATIFVAVNTLPPEASRRGLDREILGLALPALGALAADPLVSIVDTIFVGRLGVVPLAALGINASIFSMAFVLFNFLAYGTTPLVARAVGRDDRDAAGRVVVQAFVVAILAGVIAVLALQALAGPIVSAMGAEGELRASTLSYLRIRAFAGPAVLLVTAGHGAFRGYHDTRTPLLVTLGLNLVNLVLDPLFIFGFGWGLEGAAFATLIAQWVGALWFVDLLLRRRSGALGIEPHLPAVRDLLPFLRVGGELVVRTFALIGTLTLATAVATRVGTVAVAAHQVGSQLWLLLALVVDSLAVAAQAMVARYRGTGASGASRAASDRLLLWGLGTGLVLALLFTLLAPFLPRLFTNEPQVLDAVGEIFPFIILMQPLNALVFVWDGIYLGLEEFRFVAGQMLLSGAAASVVLLLVIPLDWGLQGVWWGIVTLMLVRAISLAWRYWNPVRSEHPGGR